MRSRGALRPIHCPYDFRLRAVFLVTRHLSLLFRPRTSGAFSRHLSLLSRPRTSDGFSHHSSLFTALPSPDCLSNHYPLTTVHCSADFGPRTSDGFSPHCPSRLLARQGERAAEEFGWSQMPARYPRSRESRVRGVPPSVLSSVARHFEHDLSSFFSPVFSLDRRTYLIYHTAAVLRTAAVW